MGGIAMDARELTRFLAKETAGIASMQVELDCLDSRFSREFAKEIDGGSENLHPELLFTATEAARKALKSVIAELDSVYERCVTEG